MSLNSFDVTKLTKFGVLSDDYTSCGVNTATSLCLIDGSLSVSLIELFIKNPIYYTIIINN